MAMESISATEPISTQPHASLLPPTPSTPSTPNNVPSATSRDPFAGPRRVLTLPTKLGGNVNSPTATATAGVQAPDAIETLFVHPEAKVVSFNITGPAGLSASGRRASADTSSGTLSWESPSERTLSAGQLRIYRVPSSGVSFLNSGPLLHPILKRSQCWLVDEQSKFVLRVREGQFYRMELPFACEEDIVLVEDFKKVLATVLQYEKTPSPFRRGYVPEALEPPMTPSKMSAGPREKAKKWRLNKVWEPEDPEQRAKFSPGIKDDGGPASWRRHLRPRAIVDEGSDSTGSSQNTTEDEGIMTDDSTAEGNRDEHTTGHVSAAVAQLDASPDAHHTFTLPIRPRPATTRSVITPQLVVDTGSGTLIDPLSRSTSRESDAASVASSRDSFYSADEPTIVVEAAEANEEPSDLINHDHMTTIKASRTNHSRQISEVTITPSTPTPLSAKSMLNEDAREASNPSTPTLVSDSDDDVDLPFIDAITPPDTIRLRRIHQHASESSNNEQALQPYRRNFTTQAPSRKRAISAALVQKAYSLLVGPPSHLVSLMLDIAARIVRSMQGARDMRRRMPGAWNSSHAEDEDEWNEDDFGIPLDNIRRDSGRSELRPTLSRNISRANSVASSDYDALIEGPMEGRSRSGSLD